MKDPQLRHLLTALASRTGHPEIANLFPQRCVFPLDPHNTCVLQGITSSSHLRCLLLYPTLPGAHPQMLAALQANFATPNAFFYDIGTEALGCAWHPQESHNPTRTGLWLGEQILHARLRRAEDFPPSPPPLRETPSRETLRDILASLGIQGHEESLAQREALCIDLDSHLISLGFDGHDVTAIACLDDVDPSPQTCLMMMSHNGRSRPVPAPLFALAQEVVVAMVRLPVERSHQSRRLLETLEHLADFADLWNTRLGEEHAGRK